MPEVALITILALVLIVYLVINRERPDKDNQNIDARDKKGKQKRQSDNNIEDYLNNSDDIVKDDILNIINEYIKCKQEVGRLSAEKSYISLNEQFAILLKRYLKAYSRYLSYYIITRDGVSIEIDIHEMTRNDIKVYYPLLIEIVAVYGGQILIIHGFNQGTVLKNFIANYNSSYISQIIGNYDENPGRTLVKIKQNTMVYKKYEDIFHIEIERIKKDKELKIIDLNNRITYLLQVLIEKHGIDEKNIINTKSTLENQKFNQYIQYEENERIRAQELERERQRKLERIRIAKQKKEKEEENREKEWVKRRERINIRNEEVYRQFYKKYTLLSAGDILVHKSLGNLSVDKIDDRTIYVTRNNDKVKMELDRNISITLNLKDIINKS